MLDYFKQRLEDENLKQKADKEVAEGSKRTPHVVFIAIAGKKQTGKDTSSRFMREILESAGRKVQTVAFADPLKEMCINILGLKRELVYGTQEDKETLTHIMWDNMPETIRLENNDGSWDGDRLLPRKGPMTVREVLQVVGTDIFRRMLDKEVWVKIPFNRDWGHTDVVILTDCRFPDEKSFTEQHGGYIIRLERYTGLSDGHASENELNNTKFSHVIDNNGSLDDLHSKLKELLITWGLL